MPTKERVSWATIGPDAVRKRSGFTTHRTWSPHCAIDPLTFGVDNTEEVSSNRDPLTYAANSGWIHYANSKFFRFNPCRHVVQSCGMSGNGLLEIEWESNSYDSNDGSACGANDFLTHHRRDFKTYSINISNAFLAEQAPGGPLTDFSYLDIGSTRYLEKVSVLDNLALAEMIPSLDSGFSLPQFLVELLELKALWRFAMNTFRAIFRTLATTPIMAAREFFGNDPLKKLSSGYLATIFGVLPLVKDIQKIVELMITQRKAVADFMWRRNISRTFHYEKRLNKLTFQDEDWFNPVNTSWQLSAETHYDNFWFARDLFHTMEFGSEFSKDVKDLVYHATLEYSYDVQGIPDYLMSFFAYMDHWGVNLSVSDVWEIVPFSFVVDWFWNVGNLLERYDFVNLPVSVIIYDWCRSFKYGQSIHVKTPTLISLYEEDGGPNLALDGATITPPNGLEFQLDSRHYIRMVEMPLPSAELLPQLTFPSGKKWVTASALLMQRRR